MQFLRRRSLEANGTVDPRRELRFRSETRLGQVLTSRPRESPVDDHDLPVIAKIESGEQSANRVGRKGVHDLYPASSHLPTEGGSQERLASDTVDEDSALNPPSGGSVECVADFDARGVIQPDEELEVAVFLGRVNVCLEPFEDSIRIAEEFDLVSEDRAGVTDEFGQPCDAKRR